MQMLTGTRSRRPALSGFTLVELMVVIAIAVLLAGIVIPVGKSLRDGNRMMACVSNLHAIHQALRMYYLDEGAVPPPYEPGAPGADDNKPDAPIGLYRLYVTGYLGRDTTFHCPSHSRAADKRNINPTNPVWLHSYDMVDPDAKYDTANPIGALARYKYMPYRGALPGDPDYRRQLAPPDPDDNTVALYTPSWQPDDSAVVCWCDQHTNVRRNGQPAYQVLFWGGEVLVKPEALLCASGTGPAEAWRVGPYD